MAAPAAHGECDLALLMLELAKVCDLARAQGKIPDEMLDMAQEVFADPRLSANFPAAVPLPQAGQFRQAAARVPHAPLARALDQAGPAMRWTQNPNYRDKPAFARYLETSTYCVISGKGGLIEHDAVWTGLLLMGPETFYPSHNHPSLEGYIVLSGAAEWWSDEFDWSVIPPLHSRYHPSGCSHAMRTGTEPLLALYIATGEIGTLAAPSG